MPFISFALLVLATAWLWQHQAMQPQAVGEVAAKRIVVTAGADGTLAAWHREWTLYDQVVQNEVIARLDERPVQAQLKTLEAELARLAAERSAAAQQFSLDQSDRESDHRREAFRLAWQIQQHRLDVLDRKVVLEVGRVELMRLEERLNYLERVQGGNVVSALELAEERLRRDRMRESITQNEQALIEAEKQRDWAVEQLKRYPDLRPPQINELLEPFDAAIAVQEARIGELKVQVDGLQIRAPMPGTIAAIHSWPGQNVRVGDPVVTLADPQSRYVLSFVRQTQSIRPTVGTPVDVRVRTPGSKPVAAVVSRVGPQVELVPEHQRSDPARLEWGLPVRIDLPEDLIVRPGELIDVRFKKKPDTAG
jgi:multidrug resistance efflux pump